MNNSKQKNINNLLIVNLHFWPDKSSCAAILFHIAKQLSSDIKIVDVITSKPKRFESNFSKSELEKIDNYTDLNIFRLSFLKENLRAFARIFNAIYLGLFSFFKILFGKYEIIIATSSPPILSAFLISLASKIKKIRFIYYCMDINPEIGILSGDFRNKFLKKIMFVLDKFSCLNSNPVIVHSSSMKKTLQNRYKNKKLNIKIINSLSVPKINDRFYFSKKESKYIKSGLRIIYAGNIGRFQGLENIIYTFKFLIDYKDIELIFLGEGIEKLRLQELSKVLGTNIKFKGYTSYDSAKQIIRNADLGLISLIPNMYKFAYPSKTMSYLEQAIPILAMIEDESDLAQTIIKNNIGFVSNIYNHQNLANLLIKLNNDQSWKLELKKSCLKTFKTQFSEKVILDKWKNIIYS